MQLTLLIYTRFKHSIKRKKRLYHMTCSVIKITLKWISSLERIRSSWNLKLVHLMVYIISMLTHLLKHINNVVSCTPLNIQTFNPNHKIDTMSYVYCVQYKQLIASYWNPQQLVAKRSCWCDWHFVHVLAKLGLKIKEKKIVFMVKWAVATNV